MTRVLLLMLAWTSSAAICASVATYIATDYYKARHVTQPAQYREANAR